MTRFHYDDVDYEALDGERVLDALDRQGVRLPSSCRAGACQSCLVRSVVGTAPPEAQEGLSDSLKADGVFMACMAEARDGMKLESASRVAEVAAVLSGSEPLGRDVVRVRVLSETDFSFEAGQYVLLRRADGLTRAYSIASLRDDGHVELHVRRLANGRMSRWLYDEARAGERVTLLGPLGHCCYVPGREDDPLVLAGTGTGLAPLMGILRSALAQGHRGSILVIHGGQSKENLYLHDELVAIADAHDQVEYVASVLEDPPPSHFREERVERVLEALRPDLRGARVYVCGNPAVVERLKQLAYRLGAEADDLFSDAFVTPPAKPARHPDAADALFNPFSWNKGHPWRQNVRHLVQALTVAGFLTQGILYYTTRFRPLGGLLPFMAYDSLGHMVVSSALIVWGAFFLLTLIFGRFVCGWLCPFGFAQDMGEKLLRRFGVALPPPANQPRWVRVALAAMVLGHFVVLPILASPVHVWQLDLHFQGPWLLGFPFRVGLFALDLALIFLVIGILLPWKLGARPYCKLVCETGLLLESVQPFALGRIRRNDGFDRNTCLECSRCVSACPQGIDVFEEVARFDRVVTSRCIGCLQCVDTCPNETILYSIRPKLRDPGRIRNYLASRVPAAAEDAPRLLLVGGLAVAGGVVGFSVLPPSYFHTYLLLAALGGLLGQLLWQLLVALGPGRLLVAFLRRASRSQKEREVAERILPLTPQEKLDAPRARGGALPALGVTLGVGLVLGLGYGVVKAVPPRVQDVSRLGAALATPAARRKSGIITLGVAPILSSGGMDLAYRDLHDALVEKLRMRVDLATGESYGDVAGALADGRLDMAILPAATYLALVRRAPDVGRPILQARFHRRSTYASLWVSENPALQGVNDLRGKRVALTEPSSLSGYLAPLAQLAHAGLGLSDLQTVRVAGNHSAALALLASGDVDATATYDGALAAFRARHPELPLHTFARLDGLPNDLWVVRTGTPEDLVARVRNIAAALPPTELASLARVGIDAFGPVDRESLARAARWIAPARALPRKPGHSATR